MSKTFLSEFFYQLGFSKPNQTLDYVAKNGFKETK